MKTRNISIFERVGSYLVILLSALGGIYFFAFFEQAQKKIIHESRLKIGQMEQEKLKAETNLKGGQEALEKVVAKLNEREAEIQKFQTQIPSSREKGPLINEVIKLLRRNNIDDKGIKYNLEEPVAPTLFSLNRFSFQLTISGFYADIKRFLWDIEHMARPVKYQKFDILKLYNDSTRQMDLVMELSTYFVP